MEWGQHTLTKYLCDKRTHATIKIQPVKKLYHVHNASHEVNFDEAHIKHIEPIIVGFITFQITKLRRLELHYNFFSKLFGINKIDELDMDTDSLYVAFAEKELEDCIRLEMKAE